jgi:hypothetical protein
MARNQNHCLVCIGLLLQALNAEDCLYKLGGIFLGLLCITTLCERSSAATKGCFACATAEESKKRLKMIVLRSDQYHLKQMKRRFWRMISYCCSIRISANYRFSPKPYYQNQNQFLAKTHHS